MTWLNKCGHPGYMLVKVFVTHQKGYGHLKIKVKIVEFGKYLDLFSLVLLCAILHILYFEIIF